MSLSQTPKFLLEETQVIYEKLLNEAENRENTEVHVLEDAEVLCRQAQALLAQADATCTSSGRRYHDVLAQRKQKMLIDQAASLNLRAGNVRSGARQTSIGWTAQAAKEARKMEWEKIYREAERIFPIERAVRFDRVILRYRNEYFLCDARQISSDDGSWGPWEISFMTSSDKQMNDEEVRAIIRDIELLDHS